MSKQVDNYLETWEADGLPKFSAADKKAAYDVYVEVHSRNLDHPVPEADLTILTSIRDIHVMAREACKAHGSATFNFAQTVFNVLNYDVRPFSNKWEEKSAGLGSSVRGDHHNEFHVDLIDLRDTMSKLEWLLLQIALPTEAKKITAERKERQRQAELAEHQRLVEAGIYTDQDAVPGDLAAQAAPATDSVPTINASNVSADGIPREDE